MPSTHRFVRNSFLCALLALLALAGPARAGEMREVTDMAGRKVVIPADPKRIFGAAPPVAVTLYAIAPERLIGINVPMRGDEKSLYRKEALDLPVLGSNAGMGRQLNLEEIAAMRPDLIIAWLGFYQEKAKVVESFAKIGVPVIFLKLDTLDDYADAFAFLGQIVGREAKAAEMSAYIRDALLRVREATADIPPAERLRVYYAESADGLATDCDKSFHTEPIVIAAGDNIYHCEQSSHVGMDKISVEQIVALKPSLILTQDKNFAALAKSSALWRNVEAVKNGRILNVPHAPFNWLDRPPSYMRALGIQWLANLFYPARFPLDVKAETKKFYRLFLGVDISDADFTRIME
ncbi:ABC transporter substrate-binding protein [Methylosinus sp. R-45379]|uniref:ABC transporter substrate-binding protein n=1 Tax=Methylosinus sp. R-45379 TaxID=980563 RepID=UPI0007C8A9A7|nr:ABC transporter substrate-binding protein [Methylosinus sp. R-45379]OAI28431.1 ABC transporter substrate-binding protein [Methylosinus sp. R-45379]